MQKALHQKVFRLVVMTKDKLEKIKGYYNSLKAQKKVLDETAAAGNPCIRDSQFRVVENELANVEKDFPEILSKFTPSEFYSHNVKGKVYYNITGLRLFLASLVEKLKDKIESPQNIPVTETRDFSFMKDTELRMIIERDYSEIRRAYSSQCWKSVIILSGSTIEAILVDLLLIHKTKAIAAVKAPNNNKSDITKWDLVSLIEVSVELGLVSSGVEKLSHSVREYRNLIHPGNEVRNKLTFGSEEAKIALEVLHIVHRDLSQ